MNGKNLADSLVRRQNHCPYTLRMIPALNLAALKTRSRQDKQALLWYCLRAIDVEGCGVLYQEQAIHFSKKISAIRGKPLTSTCMRGRVFIGASTSRERVGPSVFCTVSYM